MKQGTKGRTQIRVEEAEMARVENDAVSPQRQNPLRNIRQPVKASLVTFYVARIKNSDRHRQTLSKIVLQVAASYLRKYLQHNFSVYFRFTRCIIRHFRL